jgi:hypothetical protein
MHGYEKVDDNGDATESLAMLLSLDGHEAQRARNGPEALCGRELARLRQPTASFSDRRHPEF